ncbi:ribonuclease III [Agaribacterium haliotis]|uniref:ribonuclease III n=1 Tax=Agaribacterium haliotis TaxID=2013869 RepID=UPI000BB538E4|nr:ribonuclease III [Agaribacterium haliotis]
MKANQLKNSDIYLLEQRLGYQFADKQQLELALSHRSVGPRNNERLEFLGDSLLNFIIAEALFERFSGAKEGQLSRLRAHLVKGETLAEIAREKQLGDVIILGGGELKSGGFRRDSILADSVEALIGAIYQEAGLERCRERVLAWYQQRLDTLDIDHAGKDAKTRLQELMQERALALPVYTVLGESGENHARLYEVQCKIASVAEGFCARASSKRQAEKKAAALALKHLEEQNLGN